MTNSRGIPNSASVCRSNAAISVTGVERLCSFMSTIALARYSTVSNPWLNFDELRIFSTSAAGIGAPVN